MTWRELMYEIMYNVRESNKDKQACVFDCNMNNNPDGKYIPIVSINPWRFDDNPSKDYAIICNSEDLE